MKHFSEATLTLKHFVIVRYEVDFILNLKTGMSSLLDHEVAISAWTFRSQGCQISALSAMV